MTPARDNLIRRKAQQALDWATAEYELARQWIDRTEEAWCGPILRPDEGETWERYFERRRRQMDELRATEAYREVEAWRRWLQAVMSAAERRRRHPLVRLLRRTRRLGHVEKGEYGEPAPRFSWRWQNLDEDWRARRRHEPSERGGMPSGMGWPDLRHQGRAWFDWYARGGPRPWKWSLEWAFGGLVHDFALGIGRSWGDDEERATTLHVACYRLFSVYLTVHAALVPGMGRWSLSLHPEDTWALHYDLGKPGDGMSWHSDDPNNWRQGIVFLLDALFGRFTYKTERPEPPVQAVASLPEGDYPLTLQRVTATRKRPRWPWAAVDYYVDIEASRPPEFAGKGENSYDLGPDAIYGMSSPGHSYERAVGAYVSAVLRERSKRGHLDPAHAAIRYPEPAIR